jgi:phage shock protein PspC (stress-responsive transcriptional regulator)
MIAGVCSGIGEYLNVDSTLIRVLWAIFAVSGGAGILAYIVCLFIMPDAE